MSAIGLPRSPGVLRTSRPTTPTCEFAAAHQYGYEGYAPRLRYADSDLCEGVAAREVTLVRSGGVGIGFQLAWKTYRVCEDHLDLLQGLDRWLGASERSPQILALGLPTGGRGPSETETTGLSPLAAP
jgi:hypothetical protein